MPNAAIIALNNAGGAYVRRRLPFNGRDLNPGDTLTAEELASVPLANRRALISSGHLEPWPVAPGASSGAVGPVERHAVHIGAGKYHVIEGVRLTSQPITRDAADDIIAGAQPAAEQSKPDDDIAA